MSRKTHSFEDEREGSLESLAIPLKSARHSPPLEGLGEVYEDISTELW